MENFPNALQSRLSESPIRDQFLQQEGILHSDMDENVARGRAICVVEHKEFEEKDSYLLKEDRLRRLLMQEHCRDKPVAVVSIAGGARRGKSFLLSLFLRYLRAHVSL